MNAVKVCLLVSALLALAGCGKAAKTEEVGSVNLKETTPQRGKETQQQGSEQANRKEEPIKSQPPPLQQTVPQTPQRVVEVKAVQVEGAATLYSEYGQNVVAADGKYLNRVVEFPLDNRIFTLTKQGDFYILNLDTLAYQADNVGVICRLSPEGAKAAAQFDGKTCWTLRGTVAGRHDTRRVFTGYEVLMTDCTLTRDTQTEERIKAEESRLVAKQEEANRQRTALLEQIKVQRIETLRVDINRLTAQTKQMAVTNPQQRQTYENNIRRIRNMEMELKNLAP